MAKQRCLNFTLKNTWKEQKPPAILFPSSYSETSHFIMVNILMETSCTLTGYGLFLSTPMFILTAWGDQRELICHKESNTTHTHTHPGVPVSALFSRTRPGVKSFWVDPQNTLLHSMQHAHAQWSLWVGMGQDSFPQAAVISYSSVVHELRLANGAERAVRLGIKFEEISERCWRSKSCK